METQVTLQKQKNTRRGKKPAKFSIATNESYYEAKGEKVTETQWHNLIAPGKVAGLSQYILTNL